MINVFLDDCREGPRGWVRTSSVEETLSLLEEAVEPINCISLDYDLGYNSLSGLEVAKWLEKRFCDIAKYKSQVPATLPNAVIIHTSSSWHADRMYAVLENANQQLKEAGLDYQIEIRRPAYGAWDNQEDYEFDSEFFQDLYNNPWKLY